MGAMDLYPTHSGFGICTIALWKTFITELILVYLEEVPISVLLTCPKLRFLRIDNVSIDPKETFGVQDCQPQLETLEFYDCSQAVDEIFGLTNSEGPHFDPSLLRSLDVSPKSRDPIDCLPRLMRATRSSLEKLIIDDIECRENPTLELPDILMMNFRSPQTIDLLQLERITRIANHPRRLRII